MLNEAPKKRKARDHSDPTPWQLFCRTQWECFRRGVTPYLMYLFMSLLALAGQAIPSDNNVVAIVIGVACIAGGAFFNGHLCYHFGRHHFGVYTAGELHRRNALFGIKSGGDHRPEQEFRVWKGFLIGVYCALPSILLGIIAGSVPDSSLMTTGGWAYYALMMFSGWSFLPVVWMGRVGEDVAGLAVSPYWSILMALLPILVSGIFYLVGAECERRDREQKAEQAKQVEEAGVRAKANAKEDGRGEHRRGGGK